MIRLRMARIPLSRLLGLGLLAFLSFASFTAHAPAALPSSSERQFIAHRGVNLRFTIAGENSLEAIALAKRAGFAAIETDVRLSSDGELVIMHDETLNRTCLNRDGSKIRRKIPVASQSLRELKELFVLKASEPRNRTQIPTAREYFAECRRQGLLLFIEPKLNDDSGKHYRDIVRLADEILGPNNYVVTSNNFANLVIRKIGLKDVPLMGILYQTSFEKIAGLGNMIMAISTARFSPAEFSAHVARSVAEKIPTESHADDFPRFSLIDSHKVDFVSTDFLAPDLARNAAPAVRLAKLEEFDHTGRLAEGSLVLAPEGNLTAKKALPSVPFGGIYLEIELQGECKIRLGTQEFELKHPSMKTVRHQLMVYNAAPEFRLVATSACSLRKIRLALVEY